MEKKKTCILTKPGNKIVQKPQNQGLINNFSGFQETALMSIAAVTLYKQKEHSLLITVEGERDWKHKGM